MQLLQLANKPTFTASSPLQFVFPKVIVLSKVDSLQLIFTEMSIKDETELKHHAEVSLFSQHTRMWISFKVGRERNGRNKARCRVCYLIT